MVEHIRKLSTEIENSHQAEIWCSHAETLIFRAHKLDRKHLFKAALEIYLKVLKMSPDNSRALTGLAYLELSTGDKIKALKLINQAIHTHTENLQLFQLQSLLRDELNREYQAERIRQLSEKTLSEKVGDTPSYPQTQFSRLAELKQLHPFSKQKTQTAFLFQLNKLFQESYAQNGWTEAWQREYLQAASERILPEFVHVLTSTAQKSEPGFTPDFSLLSPWCRSLYQNCLERLSAFSPEPEKLFRALEAFGTCDFLRLPSQTAERPTSEKLSHGPVVKMLQLLLQKMGYPIKVSGRFDLNTTQALALLQKKYGLPSKGRLDTNSLKILNQSVAHFFSLGTL